MTALSILDLATVVDGGTASTALRETTEMAHAAERAGLKRIWVAEHHGMPGVASSSPAVVVAHLAAHTTTLRVGAGGVMLPNHAPLVIAEQFGTLEALHPGRIDLGLGRAPGSDLATMRALRRGGADRFPDELSELVGYFTGTNEQLAMPGRGLLPELWLLGSSTYSAQLAALWGLPFSFAYHFAPTLLDEALRLYREAFRPSAVLDAPKVMVAVAVVCAPTTDEAQWLSGPAKLSMLHLRRGRPSTLPTPEYAASFSYSEHEEAEIAEMSRSQLIGDVATVSAGLDALVSRTQADEVLLSTRVFDVADRIRSVELVAASWHHVHA